MNKHINRRHHSHGDTVINVEGLESYVVNHIIGKGSRSIVHLAACTRGRFRGRNVALKFIPRPLPRPALESLYITTTALHKSLHHPAVISLHSAFTIKDYHCIVLELCEGGSLYDFLQARNERELQHAEYDNSESLPLNEAQLRPILRSVVEALSYLHARGIFHQSLSAQNIFLTADGRVKLGSIGHHDAFPNCPLRVKCEQNSDREPGNNSLKSAEGHQCGVQADLTSLVHLVIALLSGIPLPNARGETMHIVNASPASTTLPTNVKCSEEAQGLLANLLKHDTLDPDNILSLPFFHPTQQTQFLDLGKFNPTILPRAEKELKVKKDKALPSSISIDVYIDAQPMGKPLASAKQRGDQENDFGRREASKQSNLPYRMPSGVKTARLTPESEPLIETYTVPGSRLSSGSSTAASSGIRNAWTKLATRQKPIPREHDIPKVTDRPVDIHTRVSNPPQSGEEKRMALGEIGNLRDSSKLGKKSSEKHYSDALSLRKPVTAPTSQPLSLPAPPRPIGLTHTQDETPIPRTNLPAAFKVPPLFPQTHKLAQGQIVVMPSHSVLVDLREGERRSGGRGDRVMCISADGQEISVYDAPHLSTPCILSEPLASWKLSSLPPRYWETYSFAAKFIESVKKRRPRMVWYTPQAKFTLMSNGPQGDLHATFPCPSPETQKRCRDRRAQTFTRMRIVLSRVRGSVEVSRFTDNKWLTKVGTHPMGSGGMDLVGEEKAALDCVLAALEVCEAAEAQCSSDSGISGKVALQERGEAQSTVQDGEPGKTEVSHRNANNSKAMPANYLTSGSGLSLSIGPRPLRISSIASSRHVSGVASNASAQAQISRENA